MGAGGSAKRRSASTVAKVYVATVTPKASVKRDEETEVDRAVAAKTAHTNLWGALAVGNAQMVARIVHSHGHEPAVVDTPCSTAPQPPGLDGDTPLSFACRLGHLDLVKRLLEAPGVNVNRVNVESEEGGTPLTIASENGQTELVRALLSDVRIDVNVARADGCTSLFMAAQNGYTDVVHLLLARPGIDLNRTDIANQFTPLLIAAYKGRNAAALGLLEASANMDVKTPKGNYNAVLIAVDRNDPVLLAALLMHGADSSAVHSNLFRACLLGLAWNARAALEAGRALHAVDEDARLSPLHMACMLGDDAAARVALFKAGIVGEESSKRAKAACLPDASGLSALYYAAELGEMKITQLLVDALGVPPQAAARSMGIMAARTLPGCSDPRTGERPSTAPSNAQPQRAKDGSTFFRAFVVPLIEDRVYVDCDPAKELFLAYLGSVAAARFFFRDHSAFQALHKLSVEGLRNIQKRLEDVYFNQGLHETVGNVGCEVEERAGGGRQDDEDLLPTFPEIHGYGPTATFYEDDYIDALQMLSLAFDNAFFLVVDRALADIETKVRHPPIKSRTRMRNKLGDPDDHLRKARPRPAHNIDTMRCSATFTDASSLVKGYEALLEAFGEPVRVKNSFRAEFDASKSYGYRSVMMNVRFDTGLSFEQVFGTSDWDQIARNQSSRETGLAMFRILGEWFRHEDVRSMNIAMAAEVQLILSPYLKARKESHLLYKVARCNEADALVSDAASRFAFGASGGLNASLEQVTRRMQERVAHLVEMQVAPDALDLTMDTINLEAEEKVNNLIEEIVL